MLYNVKLRSAYNPGLVTGLFGIGTVVILYLVKAFDPSIYMWYDYLLGVVWFGVVFWFCFRSPMYWKIGGKPGYPLSDRTAYLLRSYRRTRSSQSNGFTTDNVSAFPDGSGNRNDHGNEKHFRKTGQVNLWYTFQFVRTSRAI